MPDCPRPADARLHELEAKLEASEARLRLSLEIGGVGMWQTNLRTGEIVWWPGMAEVHGLPPGSVPVGVTGYARLIHAEDRERFLRAVRDTSPEGTAQPIEYRVRWPDGSWHWIEARRKLLLDGGGQPWAVTGVCQDITRRKRIESDLRFLAQASAE